MSTTPPTESPAQPGAIQFTAPELNVLVSLLDIAVKAAGLKVVHAASGVFEKIQAAAPKPANVPA